MRIIVLSLLLSLLATAALAGTPEAYQKKWRDPTVNQRIERNIEQYRKGDATIEVVDAAGQPVPGVRVEVQQIGHEFLFGCNAFVLGQLKTPEENQRYEEAFLRLFNFATVPLYWEGTEPTQGELRYAEGGRDIWRRPPADRYLPWAAKHGVTLKGHPLLWHAYNPPWLPKDADQLRELYRKRFREIAGRYGSKISIFDVVNESLVCSKTYPLYSPDRAYVAWAFNEVAPLFPKPCTLMINEVTSYNFLPAEKNPYVDQIKSLLAQGAQVQGIGLQYHYFRREALDKHLTSPSCDRRQDARLVREAGGVPAAVVHHRDHDPVGRTGRGSVAGRGRARSLSPVVQRPVDGRHHVVEPGRRHRRQGRERGPRWIGRRRLPAEGRLPGPRSTHQPGMEDARHRPDRCQRESQPPRLLWQVSSDRGSGATRRIRPRSSTRGLVPRPTGSNCRGPPP